MSTTYSRRGFLGRSLLVAGGIAGAGDVRRVPDGLRFVVSRARRPSSSASATVSIQLSWIKNVEFAGSYIADTNGYYKAQGIAADLVAGGPTATIEPDVRLRQGPHRHQQPGLDLAGRRQGRRPEDHRDHVPEEPVRDHVAGVASPITTPQDMIGKKIGVQAANESIWTSFLKANNIDASKITIVPAQFDPTPLANKQVDGWFSFVTNEPNLLAVKGVKTYTFLLNDFNYPSITNTYFVTGATLKDKAKRDSVVKFMRGEIKGWQENIKDPQLGADLTANNYGKALKLDAKEQDAGERRRQQADPGRRHRRPRPVLDERREDRRDRRAPSARAAERSARTCSPARSSKRSTAARTPSPDHP